MPKVHRNNDLRNCGAKTIAKNSKVFVNNQPIALEDDENTHGGGELIASTSNVRVGGKKVIVAGDNAKPDRAGHSNPKAESFSPNVNIG